MPKLDLDSSHEFWKNYDDPMVYRVIAFMETAETFTLDGNPALEKEVTKLGEAFDKLDDFDLSKEDQFVSLCAHLKSSRILRILQTMDTIDPGSASRLLMYAEEHNDEDDHPMAALFLKRNIIFERLRLMSRIFATSRLDLVVKVMEEDND